MLREHHKQLEQLAKSYNVNYFHLNKTYSNLQTYFLCKDLENNKPVANIISCESQGIEAIKVIKKYLEGNYEKH